MSNAEYNEKSEIQKAVEWYCRDYLKIIGHEKKFKKDKSLTLENFVRSMENMPTYPETIELKTPIKVEWHITKNCNLNCSFCYACAMNGSSEDATTDDMLAVIEEMHRNNVLEVQIEGGEPFLRKDLSVFIEKLKRFNIRIRLLTNGTIINYEILKAVKKHFTRNDVLQISMHGFSEKNHDEIVGMSGSYKKLNEFLRETEKLEMPIRLSSVISRKNINELDKIINFCKKYKNIESFVAQPIIPVGRGNLSEVVSSQELLLKYYSVRKLGDGLILSLLLGHAFDIPEFASYIIENGKKEERIYCSAARSRVHVDEKFDVYPCHFLVYPEFLLGNLKKNTLLEIWKNDHSNKVRKMSKTNSACSICKLNKNCTKKGLCTSYLNGGVKAQPINCFVEIGGS